MFKRRLTRLGLRADKDILRRVSPYIFALVAVIVLAYYLLTKAEFYGSLLRFSLWSLLALIGLVLGTILGLGIANYSFIRSLRVPISLHEAIGLSVITSFANHLPFSGGIVAKSVYLKQRYRLRYTDFLSGTVALYVLFVATDGFIALFMLAWSTIARHGMPPLILLIGFSAMAGSSLLFLIPWDLSFLPDRWNNRFSNLMHGWQLLKQRGAVLLSLIAVHIAVTVINAGRLWIAFHALSQDVSLGQSLIFSAASILTQLVTITPGGLGVREGIVAAVASFHGIAPDISIIAVAMDRLVATTIVLGLGAFYSYIIGRRLMMPASVEQLGEEVPSASPAESALDLKSLSDQTTAEDETPRSEELGRE